MAHSGKLRKLLNIFFCLTYNSIVEGGRQDLFTAFSDVMAKKRWVSTWGICKKPEMQYIYLMDRLVFSVGFRYFMIIHQFQRGRLFFL